MTFPANYAVIAEDELTYVTGGGVIANVLPAIMTEENWKTFSTNIVKIVGNSFLDDFFRVTVGTVFGGNYAFGGVVNSVSNVFSGLDALNGFMQFLGGAAAVYTLGSGTAKVLDQKKVVGISGTTTL